MNTPRPRIAVYGAAANPPHLGHCDCIRQLLEAGYSRVYYLPAASHAFGKAMQPFAQRYRLAEALIAEQFPGDARVIVSDLEQSLLAQADDGRVYSITVLEALRNEHPAAELHLALGPDNCLEATFTKFRDYQRLRDEFGVFALQERLAIRSTRIREELAKPTPDKTLLISWLGATLTALLCGEGMYK